MERFTSFEVQAFVTYLLKLRRWCVRMLTEVTKETHLHFPIQAAVEGMIGWGKCKSTILLLLITGLNLVLYNFSNSTHSVCANDILRHGERERSFSSATGRPSKCGYGPTGSSDAELYRSRRPRDWNIGEPNNNEINCLEHCFIVCLQYIQFFTYRLTDENFKRCKILKCIHFEFENIAQCRRM